MSINIDGEKKVFLIIGGFTVLVLILIFFFAVNEQKNSASSQIVSYTAEQSDRPKAQIAETFSDLGTMKVNEEKKAEFTIQNQGQKPLQLFNISSSCGCTLGQITIDSNKSPEFGMHSQSNWAGTVEPGKKATVDVIYRPYIMPVQGEVTRDVYVQTNDPENSKITFTVKANVE